jgi:NhaC family Na+:H+ antiporter|tara:strand:+ start:935 stop:2386 length:1452 start_codon:yes stop_codon:yes gene_type:complete
MKKTKPHYILCLFPILILIILLAYNVILFGDESLSGANQLALLVSASIATVIGLQFRTVNFKKILKDISSSIANTTPAIIILLLIGALTGTWLISGIVPAMIYYGLQILNPKVFLFATAIISAIVSLATGSSWSTIATIGIALLGIGKALGLPIGLIAGAIISGAYFGDKMSPLSDTTNLAPVSSGTDLFTHIKYMTYTTIPSFIITLIIFLIIGINFREASGENTDEILNAISSTFNINGWLFFIPIIIILLIIKKTPAIAVLIIGTFLAGISTIFFQPEIIKIIANSNQLDFHSCYFTIVSSMTGEISISTNTEIKSLKSMMDSLLYSGGMAGMMNTIWLIICAMIFGGAMQSTGLLKKIAEPILKYAKSTGNLIATTAGTCIFFNLTASDQYLSIVVPGRMFSDSYKKNNLAPENLSRTIEDSGTVTSVLVPWNTCGATQSAVLGVATLTYLPYCFFNLISPIMSIIYGYLNIKIRKLTK